MAANLENVKHYLRVDGSEDDVLIAQLIRSAERTVRDILRVDRLSEVKAARPAVRIAVLYAVAYMYEHREDADYKAMLGTLKVLLSGIREDKF